MPLNTEQKVFYEFLCDLQIPNTIKFSPNALQVLYSTNLKWNHKKGKHSVSTLWLAETGKPNSSQQITPGLFKDHSPRWNPNGQSIAFISDRAEAGKKWAIYELNLENGVPSGEAHAITDPENEREIAGFEYSPDGKSIAYICADPKTADEKTREENGEDWQVWGEQWTYNRLRTINLATKEVRRVTGSVDPKMVPERHVLSFSWSPGSKHIAVVNARSPDIEEPYLTGCNVSILTLTGQSIEDVCNWPNEVGNIQWAVDGRLYFCSGTMKDKECAGQTLYTIEPNTKASVQPEFANPQAFGIENDVSGLINTNEEIVIRIEQGLEDRLCLASGRILYSKPQAIEPNAYDAAYTIDSDEIVLAIATSDVNTPAEVYTTTASGGGLVQLSNHGVTLKGQNFGTCKFLTTPSSDNEVSLDAVLLTPSSAKSSEPQPTIVLIHGGPSSRHTNAFNAHYYFWTPYLLSLGYTLLLPNYRGSSGKGTSFQSYSVRGVGKVDYEDIITLTQHAIETGYADKERLVVGGISQGGFLSFLCSVRNGSHGHGWKFQASIPVSGVCDTDAMALTADVGATLEAELQAGRTPWNVAKDDIRNRNASALWEFSEAVKRSKETGERVIPPMLILHGEKDERCPVSQAWGMMRALRSEGLPFEFVQYPRQPHLFSERAHWVDMMGRVEAWVGRYIGAGSK